MLSDTTFRTASRMLAGALRLDRGSCSHPEIGTLFERFGKSALPRMKREIARAYGVAAALVSTNGTTLANHVAIMSACGVGERVLVCRDAHCSVLTGLIHAEAVPTYFSAPFDETLGISLGPTREAVEGALNSTPDVSCLIVTSPNYAGVVGELREIVQLAHARGLRVIVDAAHGPHFHFCGKMPVAAEDVGADLVTLSVHKVAATLSQASLLLVNNPKMIDSLYENQELFASTSPSSAIIASLELGVRQLVERGHELWCRTIERAETYRQAVRCIPGIRCFGRENIGIPGFRDMDPTRVTVDVSDTGLSGFEFAGRLRAKGVYVEMATPRHILAVLTPANTDQDIACLLAAIGAIAPTGMPTLKPMPIRPPAIPRMVLTPRQAKFARKRTLPISEAVGEISGETIACYPPGSVIIAAGELVTEDVVAYLRCMREYGASLKGTSDQDFKTMRTVSEVSSEFGMIQGNRP